MPRVSEIRYYASRGAYYTQIRKKQYPLAIGPDDYPDGPTYREAEEEFGRLWDQLRLDDRDGPKSVGQLVKLYLGACKDRLRGSTLDVKERLLRPFADHMGDMHAANVDSYQLTKYVQERREPTGESERQTGWSAQTSGLFLYSVSAMYTWGIRNGIVRSNPVQMMDKPPKRSRGREAVLTVEEHKIILGGCTDDFARVAKALAATGARPSEIIAAEARNWNDKLGALEYFGDSVRLTGEHAHKNAGKNRTRRVYFFGEALADIRELVKARPRGKLFVNSRGKAWTVDILGHYVRQLREKLSLPHFTMYSYRHTFATRWIEAGKSVDVLAELLGNSVGIIRLHYSHLEGNHDLIRQLADGFRSLG